jgi:hypothetical protein
VPVCQQRCQVRYAKNILGMVSFAKSKEFGADLRGIFAASDREQALGIALTVAEKWREKGHEKIASALLRFQDATASADRDAIENAADELITAVTKWVSFSKAHEYRKRLNGVVRRLTSEEPSTKGGQALVALSGHVDWLAPTDPLRAALDRFAGAVRANPDRWFTIANIVAGMRRAEDEGALAMTWRIKGANGRLPCGAPKYVPPRWPDRGSHRFTTT